MLYVSRENGEEFGVVDTDDGVESTVHFEDLEEAAKLGVKVYGVRATKNGDISVVPCRKPMAYQINCAKASMLLGVNIQTYEGAIMSIKIDWSVCKPGTRIRLSEYGYAVVSSIVETVFPCGASIVFVVDDYCLMMNSYFRSFLMQGMVKIDITECDNPWNVYQVYDVWSTRTKLPVEEAIIDRPERQNKWAAYGVVACGFWNSRVKYSKESIEFVESKFMDSFKHTALVMKLPCHIDTAALRSYRRHLWQDNDFWKSKPTEYKFVKMYDGWSVFSFFDNFESEVIEVDHLVKFKWLWNYLRYFGENKEIQNLYVQLVNRLNEEIWRVWGDALC